MTGLTRSARSRDLSIQSILLSCPKTIPLSCLHSLFCWPSLLRGENVLDRAHQVRQRIGFLQVSDARLENPSEKSRVRVSRGVQHPCLGPDRRYPLGELLPPDARHDDVCDQQMNRALVILADAQRFLPIPGGKDVVPTFAEHLGEQFS